MSEASFLHSPPTPTALLQVALRQFASSTAFNTSHGEITYAALADMVGRFQSVLLGVGVTASRPVMILSRNRWEAWAVASAVSAIGAAPCWLHPLGTAAAHTEQVSQIDPTAIVVDANSFPERPALLRDAFPGVPILSLGESDDVPDLVAEADRVGSCTLTDHSRPDGLGMVGLTGGTTGKSKAVERSVASVTSMSLASLASFDLPRKPRFLAVGPISHVTGTKILPTLMRGGSVSMVDKFDPEELLQRITNERISFMLAVPTMIYDMLDCPRLDRSDTSSLELLLYGGAAMSPHRLSEGLERIGPVFTQLYGQAECYPITVLDRDDHDPSRPDILTACGFPTRGSTIKLLSDELNEAPPGEIGEICVRSPGVMTRYRDAPDATEEAFAGGWLHTGDLGKFDAEGRLYIVDRKKDMIVSGGFNVYPREIEDVLTSHPDVASAAVVGLSDPRWGEAVHAAVTLRAGGTFDERSLADQVRNLKGSMLTPKSFTVLSELPQTAAGKVDKKRLASMLKLLKKNVEKAG